MKDIIRYIWRNQLLAERSYLVNAKALRSKGGHHASHVSSSKGCSSSCQMGRHLFGLWLGWLIQTTLVKQVWARSGQNRKTCRPRCAVPICVPSEIWRGAWSFKWNTIFGELSDPAKASAQQRGEAPAQGLERSLKNAHIIARKHYSQLACHIQVCTQPVMGHHGPSQAISDYWLWYLVSGFIRGDHDSRRRGDMLVRPSSRGWQIIIIIMYLKGLICGLGSL